MSEGPARDSTREILKVDLSGIDDVPLDEEDELRRAITRPLGPSPAEGAPPVQVEAPPKYRLERCLGQGGFGVVYLATDLELERLVALKFLVNAGPAEVARFRREARFAAQLNHPAVVEVYELGLHAGHYYIAMEFLAGGNLEDAQLEPRRLVEILREVADALAVAHGRGIVHRDIKPENLLLDAEGRPHITDFGIAHDLYGLDLDEEGTVVGTPDLMAPEQARGESARVDARTDVYAMGATLYALLTGVRPFARPTLLTTLTAVLRDDPRPLRELDPSIPPALEAIALRCLQKARGSRFPSMAALIEALDHFLNGTALPPGRAEPLGLDQVALALGASHTLADFDTARGRRSSPPPPEPLVQLHARLTALLRETPDLAWLRFVRGQAALRLGRYGPALEDLERSVDRLSDQGWAQRELGELYLRLALWEQEQPARELDFVSGLDHLEVTQGYLQQALIAFESAGELGPHVVSWHTPFAHALNAYASRSPRECVARCDEILARDPDLPWVWRLRGLAEGEADQDPRPSFRQALAVRPGDAPTLLALGEAELAAGDWAVAGELLERALVASPSSAAALCARAGAHLREEVQASADPGLSEALRCLRQARQGAPLPPAERRLRLGDDAEQSRALLQVAWIQQALEALDRCESRADGSELLRAKALLLSAEHVLRHGEDPSPDLDGILRSQYSDLGQGQVRPWLDLLADAWIARDS